MLRGEHIRRKLYASYVGISENLRSSSFRFTSSEKTNTLPGCIKGLKGESKLQRRYLDIKKQEGNYEQRLFSFKCNQQCTPDVFKKGK